MCERDYHATWVQPWLPLRAELMPLLSKRAARAIRDQRHTLGLVFDLLAELGDPPPLPGSQLKLEFTRREGYRGVQPRFFSMIYSPIASGAAFRLSFPHCLTAFLLAEYRIILDINDCQMIATLDETGRLIWDRTQADQLVAAVVRAYPGLAPRQRQLRAELGGYLASRLLQFARTLTILVHTHADTWPAPHIAPLVGHAYKLRRHTLAGPAKPHGSPRRKRRKVDGD